MTPELCRFSHEAMNCVFGVTISGHDRDYARQAAGAVFNEIDRIEKFLSRFIFESDVGRINMLKPGQGVKVSPETMECLLTALWVYESSGGAFDITLGPVVECFRGRGGKLLDPDKDHLRRASEMVGMDRLELDPDNLNVAVKDDGCSNGVLVDLGGIGKGYALDRSAELFADWDVENVLIDAGGSTVLGLGFPGEEQSGWKVGVGGDWGVRAGMESIVIKDRALSGSGTEIKGEHIIDPRLLKPGRTNTAAWSVCPSAAVADALSTAFMIMKIDEIEGFIVRIDEIEAYIVDLDQKMLYFSSR